MIIEWVFSEIIAVVMQIPRSVLLKFFLPFGKT